MKAEIITIGDELLIGQVIDTNSAFIAKELNSIGIAIAQITSISDQASHIRKALTEAASRSEIIIMTGGLGPTKDDITKKTLAEHFGLLLVEDPLILENLQQFIQSRGFVLNDLNRQQALVPQNCRAFVNQLGTAPGMWIQQDTKIFISLPGVPYEMMHLMQDSIIPALKQELGDQNHILHKTIVIHSLPESLLAEKIADWEDNLPAGVKLAYLPAPGRVRLRLSSSGSDLQSLQQIAGIEVEKLYSIIPKNILYEGDIPIEKALMDRLIASGMTLAVAESCTGGSLASLLTSQPGSSAFFPGGIIAYSNDVKINLLHVNRQVLEHVGAVSREVAEQMAAGVRKQLNASIGIGITGIAGPDGGTPEKPVGTVWIAWNILGTSHASMFRFHLNRQQNIQRAVALAVVNLINLLNQQTIK